MTEAIVTVSILIILGVVVLYSVKKSRKNTGGGVNRGGDGGNTHARQ